MKRFTSVTDPEVIRILCDGGIGVLRTDTLYGVVAKANDFNAVERVYALKGRDDNKSPIVLISSTTQIYDAVTTRYEEILQQYWPGKVSVIIPSLKAPDWITRGNKSVAYRLPAHEGLRKLTTKTGPLVAPSANPQGSAPAMTYEQAYDYFGNRVDFYVDEGIVTDVSPSRLLQIKPDGTEEWLR